MLTLNLDRNKPRARCERSSGRARTFRAAASPPEQSGITKLMFAREGQQGEAAAPILLEDRCDFFVRRRTWSPTVGRLRRRIPVRHAECSARLLEAPIPRHLSFADQKARQEPEPAHWFGARESRRPGRVRRRFPAQRRLHLHLPQHVLRPGLVGSARRRRKRARDVRRRSAAGFIHGHRFGPR